MPRHHPPAFQFYPDDFASDGVVEAMTTEEVGAYILLLCKSWRENPPGSIPDDDRVLSRWARLTPERWSECRTGVLAAFKLGTDSRWHQKRMRDTYADLMSLQRKRTESGKAGAKGRWDKPQENPGGMANACESHGKRIANPMANDGSASATASAKNSSGSSTSDEKAQAEVQLFFERWNANKHCRPASELSIQGRIDLLTDRFTDPAWLDAYPKALARLPLRAFSDPTIHVKWFLDAETVWDILSGKFDFEPGRRGIRQQKPAAPPRMVREKLSD